MPQLLKLYSQTGGHIFLDPSAIVVAERVQLQHGAGWRVTYRIAESINVETVRCWSVLEKDAKPLLRYLGEHSIDSNDEKRG